MKRRRDFRWVARRNTIRPWAYIVILIALTACFRAFTSAHLPRLPAGITKDDVSPNVETLDFVAGLRGPSGVLAPYYGHEDLDADGIPDVFEAGLLSALLQMPTHPLYSAAKRGFQDCCDKLWLTNEGAAYIELFTFYMGCSAQGRDVTVWAISVDQNVPEDFQRPYALVSEYSQASYGLITGADDLDLDDKTNRQEFLEACTKFGLDGTKFDTWTTADWGTAYVNNLGTTGHEDVMASFIAGTIAMPALPRTVSGTVLWNGAGLDGVELGGLLGVPVTDLEGFYTAGAPNGWSGIVTPAKAGFTFTPETRQYAPVTTDQLAQDFVAQQITFNVTGKVTWNGTGMADVTFQGPVADSLSASDGSYTAPVPYNWTGSLTPQKEGFSFSPASRSYSSVMADKSTQNYTATQLMRTISGHIEYLGAPLVDVVLQGLPSTVTTDTDGIYTGSVPYGWSGTVTPVLSGYAFEPPSIAYTNVTEALHQQIYVASRATFSISGVVLLDGSPLSGVSMQGLPGSPVTDADGAFSAVVPHQWTGTVTPVKSGFTFEPSSRSYASVAASQANQDYAATQIWRTIGGTITSAGTGLAGVTFDGVADAPTTDANGAYEIIVPYGWSGTITPVKLGYTFEPGAHSYVNFITSLPNENYVGTLITFTVTGRITLDSAGLANVALKGFPSTTITGPDGSFNAVVPYGWTGTVRPQRDGYLFEPAAKDFTNVTANLSSQTFEATRSDVNIAGQVTWNGEGLEAVTLKGLPGNPTTQADGTYTATVSYDWTGTITPEKAGFTFSPASRSYSHVQAALMGQDYAASQIMLDVSGTVTWGTHELANVTLSGFGSAVTSNSEGVYTVQVPYGFSGTITPAKDGFTFAPATRVYTGVTSAQTAQDYTATPTVTPIVSAPRDGSKLYVTPGATTVRLALTANAPAGTTLVEYTIDGQDAGDADASPFLVEVDWTPVSTGQHVVEAAVTLAPYPDTVTARAQFTVVSISSATMDTNSDGLPDAPFTLLANDGDRWSHTVSTSVASEKRYVELTRFSPGNTTVPDTIPLTVSIVRADATARTIQVTASRALLTGTQSGLLLLESADNLNALVGTTQAGNMLPLPTDQALIPGGQYVEASVLASTDGGTTYAEVSDARVAAQPLHFVFSGMAPELVRNPVVYTHPTNATRNTNGAIALAAETGAWSTTAIANQVFGTADVSFDATALSTFVPLQKGPAPDVESLDFVAGLRGPEGVLAPYYAHKDLDADGIPDVFEAGLLQALLAAPSHPLHAAAQQGFQDCCDRLWLTEAAAPRVELFALYMGASAASRDFAVWEIAVDQNAAEAFKRPYALISEYSLASYGLIAGGDNLDLDGKTNRQEFLDACTAFGLDGTKFDTWTAADWATAYVANLGKTGGDDVMSTFIADTIVPLALPRTVSGTILCNGSGLSGVTLNGLVGSPVTDANGAYSANTPNSWTGTVKPAKSGYAFTPQTLTYTAITEDQLAQDFAATQITFNVTGRVTLNGGGMADVAFHGPMGDVTSASDGSYSVQVPYNWTGTLSPKKAGFTFSPSTKTYMGVTSAQSAQNYTAAQVTCAITGYVEFLGSPLADVAIQGLPGTVKTGTNGTFSGSVTYGWSGTVTPVLTGYVFNPAYSSYTSVTTAQGPQIYSATLAQFSIAGVVLANGSPVAGVSLQGLPGSPTTDAQGAYNASIPYEWSGTVTPVKSGFTFDPPSRTYASLTVNQAAQNFAATQLTRTIGGTVTLNGAGLPGVTFTGISNAPTTDTNGTYVITVPYGWSGTVTPVKQGYTFAPSTRSYANFTVSSSSEGYVAAPVMFTVAGRATVGGVGLGGVALQGFPSEAATGADGAFSTTVPYGWTGTVTPQRAGYTFEPASKNYANVTSGQSSQNFSSTLLTFAIAGKVTWNGTGLDAVTLLGLPGNPTTHADGTYTATVDYDWSGTVTPRKAGFTFTPASKDYSHVKNVQAGQDYPATQVTNAFTGTVTWGTRKLAGVTLRGFASPATTNSEGVYTVQVPYGFSGTITPSKDGFTFNPPSRSYDTVSVAQTAQNYAASATATAAIATPQNGSKLYVADDMTRVLLLLSMSVPTNASQVEYSIDGHVVGSANVSPYLVEAELASLTAGQHVVDAAITVSPYPAPLSAQVHFTVIGIEPATMDADADGLPDAPFTLLANDGDRWCHSVNTSEATMRRYVDLTRFHPGTATLPDAIPLAAAIFPAGATSRAVHATASRALLSGSQSGLFLLESADSLNALLGTAQANEMKPEPAQQAIVPGAPYVEASVLASADAGLTFAEISDARVALYPVHFEIDGITPDQAKNPAVYSHATDATQTIGGAIAITAGTGSWTTAATAGTAFASDRVEFDATSLCASAPYQEGSTGEGEGEGEPPSCVGGSLESSTPTRPTRATGDLLLLGTAAVLLARTTRRRIAA